MPPPEPLFWPATAKRTTRKKPRRYKTKSGAQDAHEAIRPSDVRLDPESIRKDLTAEQYKLYKLIWSRVLASQMASAVYDSVSIDVEGGGYIFRANHSPIKFSGFTAVYEEGRDDDGERPQSPLPDLREGEKVAAVEFAPEQHFTQPPARYTEATLIKALEEKSIGRPSTYAPTVSTIMDRQYVVKEGRALRPTALGEVVTGLMREKFTDIVDYAFTAQMEERLDQVEQGEENWKDVLRGFYSNFTRELTEAEKSLDGTRIKVPDEVSEEICPVCGRNLVFKMGRFGRFLACPGYPDCTYTQPIVEQMPGRCPLCGGRLMKRTGKSKRTGKQFTYYGCEFNIVREGNPHAKCDFMTFDVPVKDDCPACGHTMFKKSGRGAKKPFCINEKCANFTPEDKRGGYQPKAAKTDAEGEAPAKAPAKKTAAKKTTAKKTTTAAKKTTAKKTATAAKKAAAKKPAARKTAEES